MITWIFQGNPKVFDIDTYLRNNTEVYWTIRQRYFEEKMKIGDTVYFWRSDGYVPKSGGIVAKGKIISKPMFINENEDTEGTRLWKEYSKDDEKIKRVKIKLIDVRLTEADGMIKRTELKTHPVLKNLHILRFSSMTNYKLSSEEAKLIEEIWKEKSSTSKTK
ncbi:EVE domain-containing protein [Persephonella sp.]